MLLGGELPSFIVSVIPSFMRQVAGELDAESLRRMKLGSNWRGCSLVACAAVAQQQESFR
jgi:hypothetical protein